MSRPVDIIVDIPKFEEIDNLIGKHKRLIHDLEANLAYLRCTSLEIVLKMEAPEVSREASVSSV